MSYREVAILALALVCCLALPYSQKEKRNAGEDSSANENDANVFLDQSDGKSCFVTKYEEVTRVV